MFLVQLFNNFKCLVILGSASTGSTKSATMELYTASSYNETMSGGGETLSSISEKSCISGGNNHHHGEFPPQAYLVSLNYFDVDIGKSPLPFYLPPGLLQRK